MAKDGSNRFVSYSGWRDFSRQGEPAGSVLKATFKSAGGGLAETPAFQYSPEDLLEFLGEYGKRFAYTPADIALLEKAFGEGLTKLMPTERKSGLEQKWVAYQAAKTGAAPATPAAE